MRRFRLLLASLLTSLGVATAATAAIQVTIVPPLIPVGGQATVDIMITADPGTKLQAFAFRIDIGDPYGVDNQLEFVEPAPSYASDPAYVFFGATMGPAGDAAGSDPAFVWVGSDLADLAPSFYVDLDGTYLLARLLLTHSALSGGDPIASGRTSFALLFAPADTGFFDDQGNEIDLTLTDGAAEIVPASTAAVPEPATWLIFAGLAVALPCCRRRG